MYSRHGNNINDCLVAGNGDVISLSSVWPTQGERTMFNTARPIVLPPVGM